MVAYAEADPISRRGAPGPGPLHVATSDDDLSPIPEAQLLRDPPARDWMVDGVFLRSTVALISGDGGRGKSLICQQLATSAALGRNWLGLALKPGRALYLACEDDQDELHRRQWAINRSLDVAMEDVLDAGLDLHPRVGRDSALMVLDRKSWRMQRTKLMDRLVSRCRGEGIQYVVVDTATATFWGNQNDEQQVAAFITELRRLAVMMQGLVIITKHPSMAGRALGTGESGNVAWNNSVRARLYLRDEKAGGTVLETMKSNYGAKGAKIPVKWQRGVFIRDEPLPARDYSEPGGYA